MHDYELYGFSVFETLIARRGEIPNLKRHWQRLHDSAICFGMQPPSYAQFSETVTAAHDNSAQQVIRVTLHREGGRWQPSQPQRDVLSVLVKEHGTQTPAPQRLTLAAQRLPNRDPLRLHKTGNRIVYQAANLEALRRGFDDCLYLDQEGRLLETTYCNLLYFIKEQWCTPTLDAALLPGVKRADLLAQNLVIERDLEINRIAEVQSMALCNAVLGVVPVERLDEQTFDIDRVDAYF
jgi:branched-subunit amino acid aminotransferase/4-amino-4-deoxychorismate lyase